MLDQLEALEVLVVPVAGRRDGARWLVLVGRERYPFAHHAAAEEFASWAVENACWIGGER
jgi:hypothetical protein